MWQIPRLDPDRRVLTGTAAGIARELGIDTAYVRAAFVVLALAGGWGIVLYLAAWLFMAKGPAASEPYEPIPKAVSPDVRLVGFAMIVAGLLIVSVQYGAPLLGPLVWPSIFIGAAVVISLDQSRLEQLRPLGDGQQRSVGSRIAIGLTLLLGGVFSASFVSLSFWQATAGTMVAGLVLVGAGIVFAPIISGLASDLMAERRRRIRSEERADMAAHLHDSVLQTLTLIQKRSNDAAVVGLARRQERELRSWLFDAKSMHPNLGFRAELEQAMAEVEDLYEVPVEVVVVGDCPADADLAALVRAVREAATNAAKHAGASRIDVFAEVGSGAVEVFVRDLGAGFDLDAVADDRVGIRDSIIGRLERHGGTAAVHSSPGTGTEVELRLPRVAAEVSPDEQPAARESAAEER